MTKATAQLIEEYKAEYLRVNGRTPLVKENHGWITLDNHFVSTFRVKEMRAAIVVLKSRASFYK
jgi:hypothetical protein